MLKDSDESLVIVGNLANRHAAGAAVRALAAAIADLTGARLGRLSEGANASGACLAGLLPHRARAGAPRPVPGNHVQDLLADELDTLLLFGNAPDLDVSGENVLQEIAKHGFVAAFTPYRSYSLETCADLLLPLGTFAETSGTFVNCEGRWQSFGGIATPVGEARPGWKILRVLANQLEVADSEYQASVDVRDELKSLLGDIVPDNSVRASKALRKPNAKSAAAFVDVPMYDVDAVVRRAVALQLTPEARRARSEQA
jgi:NADH-quinone oxidoreductase subunit G